MSRAAEQFPFVEMDPAVGALSLMPLLPLTISRGQQQISISALLDTGAAVSVLPYRAGLQLGAQWDQQKSTIRLTGNLSNIEARALVATAQVGQLPPVRLAFAWAQSDSIPVILGQTNFFREFDVCFFRSRSVFEVRPKS